MCYMEVGKQGVHAEIGIRHLRQNLSVYLERVKRGEELTVTERGVPVARLAPLRKPQGVLAQLLAAGTARPPARDGGVEALPPPLAPREGRTLSQVLQEMRDEDTY